MSTSNNVITTKHSFYTTSGTLIQNVISVTIDANGEFSVLSYTNDSGETVTLTKGNYTYTNLILTVPGIGYAYCGDTLYIEEYRKKPQEYKLDFGWHQNYSKQQIYSWYLIPQKCGEDIEDAQNNLKTLYYTDLTNIIAIESSTAGLVLSSSEVNQ